jgi:hypothetical protein
MIDTGLEELTADDWQRLEHYNGEVVLEYSAKIHAYTVVGEDGVRVLVPGVTTVIGTLDKSGPLTAWAANSTVAWFVQNFPVLEAREGLAALYQRFRDKAPWDDDVDGLPATVSCSTKELANLLNEARGNYRALKQTACDVGNLAHMWLEGYVKALIDGEDYSAPMPDNPFSVNGIQAALKWFARHKFRPVFSEKKMYSREHGFSGTCDWEAYVTPCEDTSCCPHGSGEEMFELGDFKTSRSLYDEYRMQAAAYVVASEEEFPERPVDGVRLLHLDKGTAEFESWRIPRSEVDSDFDGFLGLLQTYHWQKQLEYDRRYVKDVARAEKKAAKAAADALKPKRKRRAAVREVAAEEIGIEIEGETPLAAPAKRASRKKAGTDPGIQIEGEAA